RRLVGAALGEHRPDGVDQDAHVFGERPVANVEVIQSHALLEGEVAATEDLPIAGDAGCDTEALALPAAALFGLVEQERPGPNQAHLSTEDVEELRELVQAKPPEPAPHAGDARIVLALAQASPGRFVHAARPGRPRGCPGTV